MAIINEMQIITNDRAESSVGQKNLTSLSTRRVLKNPAGVSLAFPFFVSLPIPAVTENEQGSSDTWQLVRNCGVSIVL